jgi:hypothetical protein
MEFNPNFTYINNLVENISVQKLEGITPLMKICKRTRSWDSSIYLPSSQPNFLKSALDGDEWSVSYFRRFFPGETAPGTHRIGGWVGPSSGLHVTEIGPKLLGCPARGMVAIPERKVVCVRARHAYGPKPGEREREREREAHNIYKRIHDDNSF